ncbi:putative bifunctional diguanylate cyclase/phosphodiesterase [Vibrio sp. WJH972]
MTNWFYNFRFNLHRWRKRRAMVELVYAITIVLILIALSLAFEVEFVETLYDFTRAHEDWELDEIIFSFLWIAVVASIYSIRRIIDINNLNKSNEYNANHDSLTGLPNRDFVQFLLTQMLHRAKRYNYSVGVIFLDLNDFKIVNDSFGHDHGDRLLEQVGQRLSSIVRSEEVAARLGGDEFLVIVERADAENALERIINRIQVCIKEPFDIYEKSVNVGFSIGVALSPDHGESISELLVAADMAMYEAKSNKSTPVFYYNDDVGERHKKHMRLSTNLKHALFNNEFHLVFQPIVNTHNSQVVGYEALIRWELDGEYVDPELIISLAENMGLSDAFFQWLLQAVADESESFQSPNQFVSVNVTIRQFLSNHFLRTMMNTIQKMKGRIIHLEITESTILKDFEKVAIRIHQLRLKGVYVMIDDFGTGYSSLGRLRDLDIDKLKIDKSFLSDAMVNDKGAKIFESMIALANTLEIEIVAEGIETKEQLKYLRQFPPMLTQGYLIQKPLKKDQLSTDKIILSNMNERGD